MMIVDNRLGNALAPQVVDIIVIRCGPHPHLITHLKGTLLVRGRHHPTSTTLSRVTDCVQGPRPRTDDGEHRGWRVAFTLGI